MNDTISWLALWDFKGCTLNPQNMEGQIYGGIAQGLGYALSEEAISTNGHIMNPNLTDYKLPTTSDIPPIVSAIVEAMGKRRQAG